MCTLYKHTFLQHSPYDLSEGFELKRERERERDRVVPGAYLFCPVTELEEVVVVVAKVHQPTTAAAAVAQLKVQVSNLPVCLIAHQQFVCSVPCQLTSLYDLIHSCAYYLPHLSLSHTHTPAADAFFMTAW